MAQTLRTLFGLLAVSCCLVSIVGVAEAEIIREPYLQSVTQDSVIVVWRTDSGSASDSRVHFGTSVGTLSTLATGSSTIPSSNAGARDHVVAIGGLQPATKYFYDVGTGAGIEAGGTAQHFFVTAPVVGAAQAFEFWVVGDSGNNSPAQRSVRDAMLGVTAGTPPDLFLHVGDIAYNSGTDSEFTNNHFAVYSDVLRHTPFWPAVGNHEASSGASDSGSQSGPYYEAFALPTLGEAGGVASGTEAYYSFDYANAHIVVLDSDDTSVSPGSPQLLWLADDLSSVPLSQEWLIAMFHHPPYSRGSHTSDSASDSGGRLVAMRENVLPMLESAGVDLVLSGHSHIYERSYLIDGAYGYGSSPNFTTPSFATLLNDGHVLDSGDGQFGGDGAYIKRLGLFANEGSVYVVAGHGGSSLSGSADHPVMYFSELANGSCLVRVDDDMLTLRNVRSDGTISDEFAIIKQSATCSTNVDCDDADACTLDECVAGTCQSSELGCPAGLECNPDSGDCESAPETVFFRQGESGYAGTSDTYIMESDPATVRGAEEALGWDTDDPSGQGMYNYALIRFDQIFDFDGGPIPSGASIASATLSYTVFNSGIDGELHECLAPWDESTTYASFGGDAGVQAEETGALISATPGSIATHDVDVTASVQAWSNDPTLNFGWIVVPTGTDGVDLRSSEFATAGSRPSLAVTFSAPALACISDAECDDASVCTLDGCVDGVCENQAISCDDSDACTSDICDPVQGCLNTALTCDDGDLCTVDACGAAGCTSTAVSCSAGEECDPETGSCALLPPFFDDFSSNNLNLWTETGEGDWNTEGLQGAAGYPSEGSGAPAAHADNCDTTCTLTVASAIDLTLYDSASLSFLRYVASSLDNGEYLRLELWNGSSWDRVVEWTNGSGDDSNWHAESFDLAPYLAMSDFQFRFVTHMSSSLEHVLVDDVLLSVSKADDCAVDVDCADADACTVDSCDAGVCINQPETCSDADPCTVDSCDSSSGCVFTPLPDSDADGVCDSQDQCQGSDASGDGDADGVCDDMDLCSGDDASGDTDSDGVCDDLDQCDGVDASGDSDADGVCDDIDLCTGDDASGDTDSDGLCDDDDFCVGDNASGDSDLDGVCDDLDQCSGDDASGDTDGDGICGDLDACSGDDASGDTDGDGVCDDLDACVGNDATGDVDSDGICNDSDVCQGNDATGDADLDGVCNDIDLCSGDDASGDTDSDGICDDTDLCTGDNSSGDSDDDGVCEDLDQCLGDDSTGDADADGICGDQDQCTGDDATGDSDGDGVCDDLDACLGDDASGDADADGICNENDVCTGDDASGDTDGDGLCDDSDACDGDNTSGDSDLDGVCDDLDPCPLDATDSCLCGVDADCDDADACTVDTCVGGVCSSSDNGSCDPPSMAFLESDGLLVIEAEHFDANTPQGGKNWALENDPSAAGGAVMHALPDSGTNNNTGYTASSPRLDYSVLFSTVGTYTVWVRGRDGGASAGSGDSIHIGLDGAANTTADRISDFTTSFGWASNTMDNAVATLTVSAPGLVTLNAWMREDGFVFDKLLLTLDSGFSPAALGPGESSRDDCNSDADCDDGDVCNGAEVCTLSGCATGGPLACDDLDPCTSDGCEATSGCFATELPDGDGDGVCDAEDACPTDETNACVCELDADCDDADPCTDNSCSAGACVFTDNGICAPGPFIESGGLVVVEAENFETNTSQGGRDWVLEVDASASGGSVMHALPDSGTINNTGYTASSPRLDFPILFSSPGTYRVWVRGRDGGASAGSGDSIHVGLDGAANTTADRISDFTTSFGWANDTMDNVVATLTVNAPGLVTLNAWMREDGFVFDKLLLTTDPGFVPSGFGPPESSRDACSSDAECDDGNACNGLEVCSPSGCGAGVPPVCDDADPCTIDSCVPASGCAVTALPDSDGDGTCDAIDVCQGNDATGDTDSDGVCDDVDACQGNDASGDSDSDGICDDTDLCTGDNATGDTDSDGICDNLDVCTGSDSSGDSDSDGICDDTDLCTGDNATGDTDSDGICDNLDVCTGSDASGDTDGDGVCDDLDVCTGDDSSGDTDSDGICDNLDLCTGNDAVGDADADGICDDTDACAGDNATGDTDSDGVCDDLDVCDGDDASGDSDGDGVCDDGDPCPLDATDACVCSVDSDCDDSDACTDDACVAGTCDSVDNGACAPGAFREVGGLVVMEAENFETNISQGGKNWVLESDGAASGGSVMHALSDSGVNNNTGYTTNSPRLDFPVLFTSPGTYRVWVLGRDGGASAGSGDSIHVGLNGAANTTADRLSDFTTTFGWANDTMDNVVATLTVSAPGLVTVNAWMREDGFIFDKLLLTLDTGFTPSGLGPDESDRGSSLCGDGDINGDETDVDCGGGSCGLCDEGQSCVLDVDCTTDNCQGGFCASAPLFNLEVRHLVPVSPLVAEAFANAAARWQATVTADIPDVNLSVAADACGITHPAVNEIIDDVVIFSSVEPIDGPGAILGSAGPCYIRTSGSLPILGVMRFDSEDLATLEASGLLEATITHEMGHVLGLGTLWSTMGLLVDPSTPEDAGTFDTHFTGGVAESEFDDAGGTGYVGAKVPVENLLGGAGTLNGHWREGVFESELMTGYIDPVFNPLSRITVGALEDMGFVVGYSETDPYALPLGPSVRLGPIAPPVELVDDIHQGPIFTADDSGNTTRVR